MSRITALILFNVAVVFNIFKVCRSAQCYSCVYIPGHLSSQGACSDPWPWYRESFGQLYKPPLKECPHSCMKIVMLSGDDDTELSVVRSCGPPCSHGNHSLSSTTTTTTTCCQGDLCNHGYRLKVTPYYLIVAFVLIYLV